MEETLFDKGVLEKLIREGKSLAFLYNHQQSWNLKQAITLKHLIVYVRQLSIPLLPVLWGDYTWSTYVTCERKMRVYF